MSGFSRQVDALSRAMFRKAASEATPLADRLPLLSSLYGLLNGTIIHAAWEPARAGEEEILTPLCFCLADYFYFDPAPEEDPWFLFLRDTVTRFGEGLASSPHWEGLSLEESLARIGLMNRYSYMFLDHRWDRLVGEAFRHYAARGLVHRGQCLSDGRIPGGQGLGMHCTHCYPARTGGCIKIEITYHSVIPSVAEGAQDWLSEMFRRRFTALLPPPVCRARILLNMTDYTLIK